jgi:hypothetical protein
MLINPLILCETGMEIEQGFWREIGQNRSKVTGAKISLESRSGVASGDAVSGVELSDRLVYS